MAQRNTYREDEELEEQINFRDILRVGKYLKPYMAQVARILVVVISMSCIVVAVPYLTKIMIDEAIPNKDLGKLGILAVILAALIVLYEFGLRYRTVAITRVGQLMLKDMRRDIFTHIQTLPFSYFDSRPHGKILIRVVNYVNTLSDTLSSGLINVISDVFTFVITLIVMFVIDWQLALWSLILFPVLIIWVRVLQIFQRRAFQKLSNKQSNLNAYIHESIAGVKTTQTFAQEQAQFRTLPGTAGRGAFRVDARRAHPVPHVAGRADHLRDDHLVHLLRRRDGLRGRERDHRRAHRVRRLREQLLESGDQHRQLL